MAFFAAEYVCLLSFIQAEQGHKLQYVSVYCSVIYWLSQNQH